MNLEDLSTQLITTPQVLRKMLLSLEDTLLSWRPEPKEWCIKEIVGHLIEADRLAFHDRIQLMLDEDQPRLPSVDVDAIAAVRQDGQRNLLELLDTFSGQRPIYADFVRQLTPEQLQRTAVYKNYGIFTVSDFVTEWLFHDYEHIKQISSIIRASLWPQMSETMQRALKN